MAIFLPTVITEWLVVPGDEFTYWPTEIYTSQATTRTTTNTDSSVKDWDVIEIERILVSEDTNTAGTIAIQQYDETVLASLPFQANAAGSVTSFRVGMTIDRFGIGDANGFSGFSVKCSSAGTANITVTYRKIIDTGITL